MNSFGLLSNLFINWGLSLSDYDVMKRMHVE